MASRRGSRRTTRWVRFNPAANTVVPGTPESASVIATDPLSTGATILRVVGSINWTGLTVDTAVAYFPGLLVAPSTMDAADMDGSVDLNLDWMYWGAEGSRQPAYDGVDSFVEHPRWIDLRGRRKLDEGESLFYNEAATGANVTSFVKLSVLVLNP